MFHWNIFMPTHYLKIRSANFNADISHQKKQYYPTNDAGLVIIKEVK